MLNELNTPLMLKGLSIIALTLLLYSTAAIPAEILFGIAIGIIVFISQKSLQRAQLLDEKVNEILSSIRDKIDKEKKSKETSDSAIGLKVKSFGPIVAKFKDSNVYETVVLENDQEYEFVGTFDYEKRDKSEIKLCEDEIMLNNGVIYKALKSNTRKA